MKSLEVINDTMTVDGFIYELMQYGADAPGSLDTPNARVVINAKNSTQTAPTRACGWSAPTARSPPSAR